MLESKEENEYNDLCQLLKPWPTIMDQVDSLRLAFKRRKTSGSYETSKQTTILLRNMVGSIRWTTASQLIEIIRLLGQVLISAHPLELAVGNIIRRVLYTIREEYVNALDTQGIDPKCTRNEKQPANPQQSISLHHILEPSAYMDFSIQIQELKHIVLEDITELMDEIDTLHENISDQALEHIHANEVILTYGYSRTVQEFLKSAAKMRAFKVIVVESGPLLNGQEMARCLSRAKIETILITDSALFPMMARVNKVLVSTHAVVANGGLIAQSGLHNIALAAKELSVPLVCVAGLLKLSPLYAHDLDAMNDLVSPGELMSYEDASMCFKTENVNVLNPAYDYVPPELVDLFITNIGGHQPSYIYRLLAEYYCPEDNYLRKP